MDAEREIELLMSDNEVSEYSLVPLSDIEEEPSGYEESSDVISISSYCSELIGHRDEMLSDGRLVVGRWKTHDVAQTDSSNTDDFSTHSQQLFRNFTQNKEVTENMSCKNLSDRNYYNSHGGQEFWDFRWNGGNPKSRDCILDYGSLKDLCKTLKNYDPINEDKMVRNGVIWQKCCNIQNLNSPSKESCKCNRLVSGKTVSNGILHKEYRSGLDLGFQNTNILKVKGQTVGEEVRNSLLSSGHNSKDTDLNMGKRSRSRKVRDAPDKRHGYNLRVFSERLHNNKHMECDSHHNNIRSLIPVLQHDDSESRQKEMSRPTCSGNDLQGKQSYKPLFEEVKEEIEKGKICDLWSNHCIEAFSIRDSKSFGKVTDGIQGEKQVLKRKKNSSDSVNDPKKLQHHQGKDMEDTDDEPAARSIKGSISHLDTELSCGKLKLNISDKLDQGSNNNNISTVNPQLWDGTTSGKMDMMYKHKRHSVQNGSSHCAAAERQSLHQNKSQDPYQSLYSGGTWQDVFLAGNHLWCIHDYRDFPYHGTNSVQCIHFLTWM